METQNLSCSLGEGELLQRLREWKDVTSRAHGRVLENNVLIARYPRDPALLGELQRLIDAEKQCCSFLEFRVQENEEDIVVRLEVPEGMHEVLSSMTGLSLETQDRSAG